MTGERRRVRVVAALIEDPEQRGRFLVQQRLPHKSRGLQWEFPGGKVEPGETDAFALERECFEELCVEAKAGRELFSVVHAYPDLEVELVLLSAEITCGVPQPLGSADLKFLEPAQMRALPFCEADVPIVEALASGKIGRSLGARIASGAFRAALALGGVGVLGLGWASCSSRAFGAGVGWTALGVLLLVLSAGTGYVRIRRRRAG